MNKVCTMSREFKITLIVLIVLAVAVLAYIPFGPGTRQQRNLEVACELLPSFQAIIDANARFQDVSASVYTGQDGAISLTGTVSSDDDLFQLMKAVAAKRLPITISWQVQVLNSAGR